MKLPNTWIGIPALIAGMLGGALGWLITIAGCQVGTGGRCLGAATVVAALAFSGAALGLTLILSLVYRSLAEWREANQKSDSTSGRNRSNPD
jgi:hypothetical protein